MRKITFLSVSLLIGLSAFATSPISYNFQSDVAGTAANTVKDLAIPSGSTGSYGVVSFTDVANPPKTSNCLKVYSTSGTGAADLTLFPSNGTNATLFWKMYVTADTESKVGFLLRGSGTGGYNSTAGLKQGYFVDAWYRGSSTGIGGRVYKSDATTLTALDGGYGSGNYYTEVQTNFPLWFKVTIEGTTTVTINSSYSVDSLNWLPIQSNITDSNAPFTSGSVQLVYGLGQPSNDYLIDNITYSDVVNTGISSPILNPINAYVVNDKLFVSGVNSYSVFNISGVRVAEISPTSINKTVTLNKGIFMVKSGNAVKKVIVR